MTRVAVDALTLNRSNELVGELFGTEIANTSVGFVCKDLVGYCLHEVSLSEARGSINEKRVIDLAGCPGDRVCGSGGQLVGLADHELVKRIPIIQWR